MEGLSLYEDVVRAFATPSHFLFPSRLSEGLWGRAPGCGGISIAGNMAEYRSDTPVGSSILQRLR